MTTTPPLATLPGEYMRAVRSRVRRRRQILTGAAVYLIQGATAVWALSTGGSASYVWPAIALVADLAVLVFLGALRSATAEAGELEDRYFAVAARVAAAESEMAYFRGLYLAATSGPAGG